MGKFKMSHLIGCSCKELSFCPVFPFDCANSFVDIKFHTLYFSYFWIPNSIAPAGILVGAIS